MKNEKIMEIYKKWKVVRNWKLLFILSSSSFFFYVCYKYADAIQNEIDKSFTYSLFVWQAHLRSKKCLPMCHSSWKSGNWLSITLLIGASMLKMFVFVKFFFQSMFVLIFNTILFEPLIKGMNKSFRHIYERLVRLKTENYL